MTNHSSYPVLHGAATRAESRRRIARTAGEIALGLVVVAALTGAWLAFFTYFPLDFTPRPG